MAKITFAAYKELVETQGRALLNVIQSVAMGDLTVEVEPPEGIDVLSDLAVGIQMMIDDLRAMMHSETQSRLIERQSHALLSVVQAVALGNLDVEIDVPEGVEELSELAIGIEMMVDDIRSMLQEQERARAEVEASRQQLETALEEMRAVQKRYVQQEWSDYAAAIPGYIRTGDADVLQPLVDEAVPEAWLGALSTALARGETVVAEEGEDTRTLALPITWAGETIGVLGLNRQAATAWSTDEVAVVGEIVEQVGWALENQRLFEDAMRARSLLSKQVSELDCLNDIGRKIAESPPIPELFAWTAGRIPQAMQYADRCLSVIEYGGRFYGDMDAIDLSRQMVSMMRIGDESIGRVLVAYRDNANAPAPHFLDSESTLMGEITRRLTGYVETQRLLEQTQMRARQEQALLQIAATIGSSEDLGDVLSSMSGSVELLRDLVPLDAVSMATYNPGENEITIYGVATGGEEGDADERASEDRDGVTVPLEGSGPGWVVTHQRLWHQDDIRKKPMFAEDMHLIADGIAARLILPLRSGDRIIGALTVMSQQAAAYTLDHVTFLTQVANQLAQVIDRARLLDSTRAALMAEAETRRSYERREWETYLRENRRVRQNTFVYDRGEVSLSPDFWRPEMQRALREISLVTSAQARADTEPVERTSRPAGDGADKRVGLAVPIEMRGQVIGVLGIEDPEGEWRSSTDHLALIQSVAQQLGQALESARLLEATQRRAAREERTREIIDDIRSASTIEDAVKRAVQEIARVLNASEMVARLGPESILLSREEGEIHD